MRLDIGYLLLVLFIGVGSYGLYRWQAYRRREHIRIWGTSRRQH